MKPNSVSGSEVPLRAEGTEGDHRRRIWLVLWILIAVGAMIAGLGSDPLANPDEARNAEVAREMAADNNYVMPHLNGLPYADKPVLFYAATAAVMEILGPTELAARLPSLVFGLATAVLTGLFGRRLFGEIGGWIAGLATASAPLALAFSRIVIMDSTLAFLITGSIIAFAMAVEAARYAKNSDAPREARRRAFLWSLTGWFAVALGVLTKGPVAILFPLVVVAPYAAWRRASRAFWHPVAPLVLLVMVGPWLWGVTRYLPDFLHYVAFTETLSRVSGHALQRSEPFWYYLPILAVGTFPWWIPAVSGTLRPTGARPFAADPIRVLLLLWVVTPVLVLSLSTSKMPQYVLPVVPGVALLTAYAWTRGPGRSPAGGLITTVIGGLAGLAMMVTALVLARSGEALKPVVAAAPAGLGAWGCTGVAAASIAFVAWRRGRHDVMVIALSAPVILFPVVARPMIAAYMEQRSTRTLVQEIAPEIDEATELVGVETYRPAVSFYLRRTYPVASADGHEWTSNYIVHAYERMVGRLPTLLPENAYHQAFTDDSRRWVLLVGSRNPDARTAVEHAGAVLLVDNGDIAFFNPRQ